MQMKMFAMTFLWEWGVGGGPGAPREGWMEGYTGSGRQNSLQQRSNTARFQTCNTGREKKRQKRIAQHL